MDVVMPRYNIAFVPKNKIESVSKITQEFLPISFNYCLGSESIPHVTLSQFICEEEELEDIWHTVCSRMDDGDRYLKFSSLSDISFEGSVYWLSLVPDEVAMLLGIYEIVSNIVVSLRKDKYDPHLTLFNYSKEKKECFAINDGILPIEDDFELCIGLSDDVGQLSKVISKYNDIRDQQRECSSNCVTSLII